MRTLESASDQGGTIVKPSGHTNLFIKEGYRFRLVDGMITNFHVPKSSLLMLVSAFMGSKGAPFGGRSKILELYRYAVGKRYRFFSFGDGMLLL